MNAPTGAGTRFRELLARPEIVVIPGGFSPLMVRMCEHLGYESFFMAGSQTNAWVHVTPDVGVISMREMLDNARRITAASGLPLFMDGDTGFGNAIGVQRTIREAALAGVSCISLEDQESPKKSGTEAGRRCVSAEEHIGKLRAAVAERDAVGSDMVICARCDLIGAEGGSVEGAIERCIRYVEEGGADFVWLNTVPTREEVRDAFKRIPGPAFALWGGDPPAPSVEEWQELGASAAMFPTLTTGIGLQAQWEFLNRFKTEGVDVLREWGEAARASEFGQFDYHDILVPSSAEVVEAEQRFIPAEQQRDYGSTWGHSTRV